MKDQLGPGDWDSEYMEILRLTEVEWNALMEILARPPKPNSKLQKLFEDYKDTWDD